MPYANFAAPYTIIQCGNEDRSISGKSRSVVGMLQNVGRLNRADGKRTISNLNATELLPLYL